MERTIGQTVSGKFTTDGAGVPLKRILSYPQRLAFDPFLLLDLFESDQPDPLPGFPWHPHRGIITITYLLSGEIEHQDSLGNHGRITAGGAQWMFSASGIIHREQPFNSNGSVKGLQLWLNIPAIQKMNQPHYGDIQKEEIQSVTLAEGVTASIIAGNMLGTSGRITFQTTEPELYHISFSQHQTIKIPTSPTKCFFVLPLNGAISIGTKHLPLEEVSLLTEGDTLCVTGSKEGQFMLVGGTPLQEDIAWDGPIVMNTQEELRRAFFEYQEGTFIK